MQGRQHDFISGQYNSDWFMNYLSYIKIALLIQYGQSLRKPTMLPYTQVQNFRRERMNWVGDVTANHMYMYVQILHPAVSNSIFDTTMAPNACAGTFVVLLAIVCLSCNTFRNAEMQKRSKDTTKGETVATYM
jgi:hypothetical protein